MPKKTTMCDRTGAGADLSVQSQVRFTSERWQTASKLIFVHVLLIGLPTIVCYYILALGGTSLRWLHVALVALYLTSAAMSIAESTAAVWRRFAERSPLPPAQPDRLRCLLKQGLGIRGAGLSNSQSLPRCSFIVAAYFGWLESDRASDLPHEWAPGLESRADELCACRWRCAGFDTCGCNSRAYVDSVVSDIGF
ncbi:MAG: hypothetical protein AAF282_16275 [Cyanobacteria bacterium P01_A01_bin.15]